MIKKLIFKNKLFFPDLTPPKYLEFKDIIGLILRNGLRTFLGALLLSAITVPFTIISMSLDINSFEETGTYEQGVFGIITSIIVFILLIYFVISVGYTIIHSWKWYIHYFRTRKKTKLVKEYQRRVSNLESELKSEYLKAKLDNQNLSKDLEREFSNKENEIYNEMEKRFKTKLIKNNSYASSKSIDEKIRDLETEFSNIINRKTNFNF